MVPAYSNQQKMPLKNLPLPQTTRSSCEIPTFTFVMNSFDAVIKAYDRYVPFLVISGQRPRDPSHVSFGSEADVCDATSNVR
jgi:hypothetical protein